MRILIIMFIMTGCAPGHKLGDYLILTINQPCEIDGYIEKTKDKITNHNKKLVKEIIYYKENGVRLIIKKGVVVIIQEVL